MKTKTSFQKGHKPSEETKMKISETKKQNYHNGITKPIRYWKGKKRTEETKIKFYIKKTKGLNTLKLMLF